MKYVQYQSLYIYQLKKSVDNLNPKFLTIEESVDILATLVVYISLIRLNCMWGLVNLSVDA